MWMIEHFSRDPCTVSTAIMTRLQCLMLLAVVGTAVVGLASAEDLKAEVEKVQEEGKRLAPLVKDQWLAKGAIQTKHFFDEFDAVVREQPEETKAAVAEAVEELKNVRLEVIANVTVILTRQIHETAKLAADYNQLLSDGLDPKNDRILDVQAIQKLKQAQQTIYGKWVDDLLAQHKEAQGVFQQRVRDLAQSIAARASNLGDQDRIRTALTDAGLRIYNVLVEEEVADIPIMTGPQLRQLEDFISHAETVYFKLLEEAKKRSSA